jgi:hypothetical protein
LFLITGDQSVWGTYDPWTKVEEWHGVPASDHSAIDGGQSLRQGWGYEPGSHSMHDHMTGPGGQRIDRSALPGPIVIHMTNPNWVHLRDLTPITEMVKDWNKAYFNHAWHLITDVKTFSTLPNNEIMAGNFTHGETYYASQYFYKTSTEFAVPLFSVPNGGTYVATQPMGGQFVDANFRLPWNGSAMDNLHNYSNPHLVALLYNSPMHAFSGKMRYQAHIMMQILNTVAGAGTLGMYAQRNHAWRLLHECMMWKMASDHPLGISRSAVETRIIAELTSIYDNVYKPLYVDNSQTPYFKILRNFGLATSFAEGFGWACLSSALHHYMGNVLMLWKQTGLFRRMWDYSEATQKGLLCLIKTLDAHALGFFQHTDGEYMGMGGDLFNGYPKLVAGTNNNPAPDVPTGWADWKARVWPKSGSADFIHNASGALKAPSGDTHMIAQWAYTRKTFFSDIPCDFDLDGVITKLNGFYGTWEAHINTLETNGGSKRGVTLNEWSIAPGSGRLLAPTELGD